jgi:hypothetical protein
MKVYQIFKYCKDKENTKVGREYFFLLGFACGHKDIMYSNMRLFLTHKATMYKRHYTCIICVITSTPHCRIMFQKTLKEKNVHISNPCA